MTLFILRHGETRWNRERRKQGRGDSPLTRVGLAQVERYAQTLGREIADIASTQLWTSPLPRARQSASIVSDVLELRSDQWSESPLLAEMDMGGWEGLTPAEIDARYPGARKRRAADVWSYDRDGVESLCSLHARAQRWLNNVPDDGVTIAVTHGGFSRALRGACLGLVPEKIAELPSHDHGRLFVVHDGVQTTLEI